MIFLSVTALQTWAFILILVGVLLVGGVAGFFISRHVFTRYLEKNPPVNEKMIRVMMQQMGRTPSEKQVRQIMSSMNQQKNS
ncbi:MAG: YneF family protein [Bacilli bacterium]